MSAAVVSRPWREDRGPLLVAAAFLVLSVVWLGSSARYFGDERYYTDAALRMLQSGDWFTPEYADGSARLNKPLLSYWVLVASFHVAGVSLFTARLTFLVAGTLTVFLAGRLAHALVPAEPRAPTLAAAICAANVEVVTLARRSTPDVLLVLAVTVAWIGLARVLVARESGRAPAWWFWLGLGAAVAVKGALALIVLTFALGAALVLRARGVRARELLAPAPMVAALVVSAIGLAPQWLAARAPGGANLFDDQVGDRVSASLGQSAALFVDYGGSVARHLAPWIVFALLALVGARGAARERLRRSGRGVWLAAAFVLLLWLVFSLGNTHRGRYLTPSYPPAASALAALLLVCFDAEGIGRVAAILVRGATVLVGACAALAAVLLARVDGWAAVCCAVVAVLAFVPWRGSSTPTGEAHVRAAVRLALVITAVSALAVDALRERTTPSPIATAALAPRLDATLGFPSTVRGHVRVASGGRLDPRCLNDAASDGDVLGNAVILASDAARPRLAALGYRLEPCGHVVDGPRARDVWEWIRGTDPAAWRRERGTPVWIAQR